MDNKPYILVVDDMVYNLKILEVSLAKLDAKIDFVDSGIKAINLMQKNLPDLILLDIIMPEMDGFEVCEELKNNPLTKDIPIIFLSALDGVADKARAFELGGVDFITKPFNPLEVVMRVETHLERHYMLEKMNSLLRESYHELYTPLSLIKSSLSLQELENGQNEHTQNIKAAVQSLHSICEDIYYAITEKERDYTKEWIDMEEFLTKRIQLFEPQMHTKSLTYNFKSDIESPMIHINGTELERLIDNLFSNAIKYALKESCIQIAVTQIGEEIEFSITNASKKIKNAKELFKELYREDYSVTGIGMGLNIVKRICTKNNIAIDVQSNDNSTQFILRYKENA